MIDDPRGKRCWISVGLSNLIECMATQISISSATVTLPTHHKLPNEFNLFFTSDCKVGHKCRLVRQSHNELELEVSGPISSSSRHETPA
jgi:hypothetical protein